MCWRTRRQSKVWYSLHTAACNHFAAAAAALAAAAAAEANCFSVVVVVVVVVVEVVTNPSSLARSPLLRAGSADMVFCIIIYIYVYIKYIYIYRTLFGHLVLKKCQQPTLEHCGASCDLQESLSWSADTAESCHILTSLAESVRCSLKPPKSSSWES